MTGLVACRECPGLTTMEYADDHDGLCMTCTHRARPPVSPLPAPIDHDVTQPQGGRDLESPEAARARWAMHRQFF